MILLLLNTAKPVLTTLLMFLLVHRCRSKDHPNILFIVGDDVGYGDFACYGHPSQEWTTVDQLAAEGIRFTQFYSSASFCTPSRASFLTGRLPLRTGMVGDQSLFPFNPRGLPHYEVTMAEALKEAGYTTGMVGKWNLGTCINAYTHNDGSYLPHRQGFDFVGTTIPYTLVWRCDTEKRHLKQPYTSLCYLYQDDLISQQPIQFHNLTSQLVLDTKAFLHNHNLKRDGPFFFYLSLPQAHTPMFNDPRFRGKSKRGIYGDQINEMSWAISEILQTLRELNMMEETLTVFVSDHGPHLEICGEGGNAGPFKGGKGYLTEGSFRIPAIAHWPGVLPAGFVDTTVHSLMDLFPTFLSLGGASIPGDRQIDGQDFSDKLLSYEKSAIKAYHDMLYFYCDYTLAAVRYGSYKIYFYDLPFPEIVYRTNCVGDFPLKNKMAPDCRYVTKLDTVQIYNVDIDPGEKLPLPVEHHQAMLSTVNKLIEEHKKTLTDLPKPILKMERKVRSVVPCCNVPYCVC